MIYTNPDPAGLYDPEDFRHRFELALAQNEVPREHWEPLTQRFAEFNAAIAGSLPIDPIEFFDLEYIRRYEIVRHVLGLLGHGYMRGNLRIFLDTANGKFYPGLSRDNSPFVLDLSGNRTPELQLSTWPDYHDGNPRAIPLFHYLAQSEQIRSEVYKGLYALATDQGDRLTAEHQRLLDEMAATGARDASLFRNVTEMNLESLREYLELSEPEYTAVREQGALVVTLQPKSMSELPITKLAVGLQGSPQLVDVPVQLRIVASSAGHTSEAQLSQSVSANGRTLDLSPLVASPRFSTSVGAPRKRETRYQPVELERTPRKYRLEFALEDDSSRYLDLDRIDLVFVNTVTGREIKPRRVEQIDLVDTSDPSELHPAPTSLDVLASWQRNNRGLRVRRTGPAELAVPRGTHRVERDLIFPDGYGVRIQRGTELRLGAGVVMLIKGGLTIAGSEDNPVRIRPIDPSQPFGSIAALGDGSNKTRISYLDLSGGSEGWVRGAYFSGALSIHYQDRVQISHTRITDSRADDGLNIKYATGMISDSVFTGNQTDQVDLDYFDGVVARSAFENGGGRDSNGDGIDISGSRLLVVDNEFAGFIDKGASVGEQSAVLLYRNSFRENLRGVAVKDLSDAYFLDNGFNANRYDFSAYLKKRIFGGGRVFLVGDPNSVTRPTIVDLDDRSSVAWIPRSAVESLLPPDMDTVDAAGLLEQLSSLKRAS